MMIRRLWVYINQHRRLQKFCSILYNACMLNKKRKKRRNTIENQGAFLKNCRIRMKGTGNRIVLGQGVRLNHCVINMSGYNALLKIDCETYAENQTFHFEDNSCQIIIGKRCVFSGGEFATAEDGCSITIGDECLFLRDIHITTTDSHSIIERETGERINRGKNVEVGNHVWLAAEVTLLKGSKIPDDCVVGRGSIVTKKFEQTNCVIVGNPAKCIKENVEWKAERV